MNFHLINRNSIAGPIYTDRPSYQIPSIPQPWKKPNDELPHLNPSKSKVNVRSSLNKSRDQFTHSNPNLDHIRASCFISHSPSSFHQIRKKDSMFDEKYLQSGKESQDLSYDMSLKDSFYKKSPMTPTSLFGDEDRKKSDTVYLRASTKDTCMLKFDDDNFNSKEAKGLEEIRSQILALTKKVFLNQEEISKLKDRKQKDKKMQTLQQQVTQFQIQMFDICKKNTNYFSQFEDKIQKNSRVISQIKDRFLYNHDRDQEKEQMNRKMVHCQSRISELHETLKLKEDHSMKNVANQLNMQETLLKKFVNEQLSEVRIRLDKTAKDSNQSLFKFHKIEKELSEKKWEDQFFTKDSKKCINAITIERKQTIVIKEGQTIKDKTKQYVNQCSTPKKEFGELTNRMDMIGKQYKDYGFDSKREIVVRQNIYYIDPQGYLLDQNKYYLLNSKNQQIMIPDHLLSCLREHNILINASCTSIKKRQ